MMWSKMVAKLTELCSFRYSAAFSSALPPISPMRMMPSVFGSWRNTSRQSMKFVPLKGSPPIPNTKHRHKKGTFLCKCQGLNCSVRHWSSFKALHWPIVPMVPTSHRLWALHETFLNNPPLCLRIPWNKFCTSGPLINKTSVSDWDVMIWKYHYISLTYYGNFAILPQYYWIVLKCSKCTYTHTQKSSLILILKKQKKLLIK